MNLSKIFRLSTTLPGLLLLASLTIPGNLFAQQNWHAIVGAQSKDKGRQVIAFLPNEIWIHAGDSITWTFASDDIHTVTFLTAGQPIIDFGVGCPGFALSGATFDGATCVTSPPMTAGQSFTVNFSVPGNYALVCSVHSHMSGVIHVLSATESLPHNQLFYDQEAAHQQHNLMNDVAGMISVRVLTGAKNVTAGTGEMAAAAAGFQSLSIVRFLSENVEVHVGDTVEWSNSDPAMPHTITFGDEPDNPFPPSPNVSVDPDGGLHAVISSITDNVHSGILVGAPENQFGVPQPPPPTTRFRVTFKEPGTYTYKCELHDTLGMVGKVTVLP
jgi:plastocyanin